jgi:hypothetical protein
MTDIVIASAFLAALARLILLGMLAWGIILLTPLPDWAKRVAEIALAAVLIFALIADLGRVSISETVPPRPLSPSNPSIIR